MIQVVMGGVRSAAARGYGDDPRANRLESYKDPAAVTCICVDDPEVLRLVDLQAVGVPLWDAALMVWSPADARPLTWLEGFRLGFRLRFPWLTFPEAS